MTTSRHFADTHGLTGYEPNLANSQHVVAWSESQNHYGPQSVDGLISSNLPWRSVRNFTEEADAHNHRNIVAEQHVYWQGQCRNASIFHPQASVEKSAPENEQAAHDEVHVAVARTSYRNVQIGNAGNNGCVRKSIRANLDVLSRWNEMKSALHAMYRKTREEICSMKQRQNFKRDQSQNHEHLQDYQQGAQEVDHV